MTDPAPRIPSYSHVENWKPEVDDVEPLYGRSSDDVVLRAASVIPFVLVAAFGVIALVGWIIVIAFGVAAPGNPHALPIWRWVQGQTAAQVLGQLAVVIGIGLIPLAIVLAASWATLHGFRERPHPLFWPAAELFWGAVAIALVAVDRTQHQLVHKVLGLGTLDWWFLFALVAAAVILAGMRIRRLRPRPGG